MVGCTALLISTDSHLIRVVKEARETVAELQLEVCVGLADALVRLGNDDVALVLVHLKADSDEKELTRLLQVVVNRKSPCATVLLQGEYPNHRVDALLRAGATDSQELPVERGQLAYLMNSLTIRARLGLGQKTAGLDRGLLGVPNKFDYGGATELAEPMDQIRRLGPQDTTLLLTGETGTGKTRLARLIHNWSHRREEPFLVLDCGALSPGLIESELFGHVKCACSGVDRERQGKFLAAGSGTLLLDEINALSAPLQSKLLCALDRGGFESVGSNQLVPIQARLIAASSVPLELEVAAGRFRSDLYSQLKVVSIFLAPLRERREAIAPLADKFLVEFSIRNGRTPMKIAADALRSLEAYDWPGNIRQLRNVVERAVTLCPGSEIHLRDLPEMIRANNLWASPCHTVIRLASTNSLPKKGLFGD